MSTAWTILFQARKGADEAVREARRQLLQQYSRPVHRYLLAATRDEHAADELYQEFALKLVRGEFRRADPDRGRFRDFLKTALYHLLVDHQRSQRKQPQPLQEEVSALVQPPPDVNQFDAAFVAAWREELLSRAWDELAAEQQRSGHPYAIVLRLRTQQPDWSSAQLAKELSVQLSRPLDAAWVRKNLQRARAKFTDYLVACVAAGMEVAGPEEIADDLDELGLLEFCRSAMAHSGPWDKRGT